MKTLPGLTYHSIYYKTLNISTSSKYQTTCAKLLQDVVRMIYMYHKKLDSSTGLPVGAVLKTKGDHMTEKKSFSNSTLQQTETYSQKQVNINENKSKNSRNLHRKCLPIQFRIVDLDQTTCKGN